MKVSNIRCELEETHFNFVSVVLVARAAPSADTSLILFLKRLQKQQHLKFIDKKYHQYTTCNSRKRRQCGVGGQGHAQGGHVADLVDAKTIKTAALVSSR